MTATIANSGPYDATAVVATLPVPSGMELVSTSVPGGAVGTIPAGGGGWSPGRFAPAVAQRARPRRRASR